jgi:peptidoglycan/xylan/chitin deacetylase (PgdA/CDA1 family)
MRTMAAAQFPVILTYHSISDGDSPIKISPALFADQMNWLQAHARVAPLGEVVAALVEHKPLPERTVVLTFDDGFQNFYFSAASVLRRLKFPATVFLPTAYCGRTNGWPGQPDWVREEPLMTWDQISELAREGISFGAHSVNHPMLTDISADEAEREIAGSKAQIEKGTAQLAEFFAYPYGRWNPAVREIVRRHYRGACSTAAGVLEPNADPFALPRADACYLRDPAWFRRLFTGPFLAYLATRRLIRRLRGQPEGYYARM